MANERMQKVTPFHQGQNTTERGRDSGPSKVPIKTNMSQPRNAGQSDPLAQALVVHVPILPSGSHTFTHSITSKPTGARYSPSGFNGRPTLGKMGAGRATDFKSHSSAPGKNPLGNPNNKAGAKSGYPKFTPRGGGKNV